MTETDETIKPPSYDESQALTVKYFDFGNIKAQLNVYGTNENPLFLATDVGKLLGVSDMTILCSNLDTDHKLFGTYQNKRSLYLTPLGMFKVIMDMRNESMLFIFCNINKELQLEAGKKFGRRIQEMEAASRKRIKSLKQKKLSNFYFVWENILKYGDNEFKDAMAYYTDKCVYNKETKKSTTIYRGYFKTNEIENLNTLPMHLHKRLPGIVIEASAGMDGFNVLHNNYELPPLSDAKQIGATKTYLGSDEDEYDEIYCFKNASDLDELNDFLELPKEETGLQFVADTYTKWQDMKDHLRFYGFKKLHQMPEEIFKKFSATAERLKSCHSCGAPRIARQKCCSEFDSNKRIGCLFIKGVILIAT